MQLKKKFEAKKKSNHKNRFGVEQTFGRSHMFFLELEIEKKETRQRVARKPFSSRRKSECEFSVKCAV